LIVYTKYFPNYHLPNFGNISNDSDSSKHCDSNYRNNGCTYNEVSYTQKQRKLKVLKSNSERALWFLKSFGFKLDKLFLSDCQSGEKVTLQYNNEKKSAYQVLSEEDKDKVRNVVYIMEVMLHIMNSA
jgi:CRISPR/Cas system endoribonuclease Cas6 (RAMP superfamily)